MSSDRQKGAQTSPAVQELLLSGLQLPAGFSPDLINTIMQSLKPNTSSKEESMHGSWNQQEDELLLRAIRQIGPTKWMDIAKFVPTRSSKQCRERWFNCLCPDLKHEPFELWEDQMIIQKQNQLGNKWAIIAKSLPGRSPGSVKNRWYASLRSQKNLTNNMNININPNNNNDILNNGQMNNLMNNIGQVNIGNDQLNIMLPQQDDDALQGS